MTGPWEIGLVVLGFLAGSIPFGVLLTRNLPGVDVRKQGSGNIGATNVARVAGKARGAVVLALDALKGMFPVLAAVTYEPSALNLHVTVGVAAVLGHVFSPWLKFKGGKGVATALGILLATEPRIAFIGAVVYGVSMAVFRTSAVGSLLATLVCAVTAFWGGYPRPYAWMALGLFLLLVYTHRSNLRGLWARFLGARRVT